MQDTKNEKIELILKYNKHYYNDSSPIVSDKKYDQLKHDIFLLEKKFKYLKSKESPV